MDDIKIIKKNLWIVETSTPTYVIAIAVDEKTPSNNIIKSVSCKRGVVINLPFCTYKAYDGAKDAILIECVDIFRVGTIPKSFKAFMPNIHGWSFNIPFPEILINKYMPENQKELFIEWKSKYKANTYSIKFIELADAN